MKGLHNFLQTKVKPHFLEGGKLEKFYPAYDALETFAFVPPHTTSHGVHVRDGIDLKRTMFIVVIALIPALIFGIWNQGHQYAITLTDAGMDAWVGAGNTPDFWDKLIYGLPLVLPLVIVSYAVGLGVEFLFAIIKKHQVNEGFLVSGMLIPLIMPVDIPLWMLAVGTIFAVVIGKEVFGGTGMNILNVALTARAFLFFAYPTKMSGNDVWIHTGFDSARASSESPAIVDGYTGATPLADAIEGGTAAIPGFYDSFMGWIPGSVGETSVLMVLIGAGLLLLTGIGNWRIMLSATIGGAIMGLIFNWLGPNYFPDNLYLQVPWYHQLVLGGFMFGIVFMATDPVTAAQTNLGKIWYGFFIGFLAILIRIVNPAYPEGVMLAILFMNVMAPMIDHYVIQGNVKKRLKRAKSAAVATA